MNKLSKKHLLLSTLLMGSVVSAAPAFAQDNFDDDDDIVVTGTRIFRPEVASVSPVTTLGAEEIDARGLVRTEDLVNSLPQAFAAQSAFIANGASGTATVNLRGLGTARTLVLIDGRRMQAGDPFAVTPDLNQIPAQLVDRVEIVTGGASSIYGADAVAGVVNFVMDRDFEGIKLDGSVSVYQHNNNNDELRGLHRNSASVDPAKSNPLEGWAKSVTLAIGAGTDDGRGHVSGYAGWREIDAVVQADYDVSNCALATNNDNPSGFRCTGSSTIPRGRFFTFGQGGDLVLDENGPGNTFRPRDGSVDVYNYAPTNYFQRPDTRYTAGFFANYDINDHVKPYAEFQFMDDRSVAQIAFSGTFFGNDAELSCDNPLLSQQQFDTLGCTPGGTYFQLIGKRLVEGDPRQNDLRHTSFRGVVGVKGDINDDWSYDAYAQRGNTIYANTYLNDLSVNRINQALDATTDAEGNIVCSDPSNGCVPLNLWQIGGVTREAFDFISIPGLQNSDIVQYVASGYVTGNLDNPFGDAGDVGVVLGAEYRKESLALRVDQNFAEGTLAGQGGPTAPVAGEFDVKELFTELVLPVISGGPVEEFTVEAGYRYSDYSTSGGESTYKIGATLAPVNGLSFRGVYNRAVRAPNINNLFGPSTLGLFGGEDPCANGSAADGVGIAATAAQCANSGVSAAQYGNIVPNSANQYNQFSGGNPNVGVEKSTSYTLGAILSGDLIGLDGVSATVDYFNITVDDTLGAPGAQSSLNSCVFDADPTSCALVNRAPVTGSLWLGSQGFVVNTLQNIPGEGLSTEGFDFGLKYDKGDVNTPLGSGSFFVDYAGTYLMELAFTGDDCVGLYGPTCGSPTPDYRHRTRFGFNSDAGWGLSLGWRYYGGVETGEDPLPGNVDDKIKAFNWFDLSGSVDVGENATIGFGVNNLFDTDPPAVNGDNNPSNGNTFPGIYDPIGRQIFARASLNF